MRLTLVRHGVTPWNAQRRFQGTSDVELSEDGRAQARALATRLAQERPDRIYTSDLRRARETAETIAAAHRLEVIADARLREFEFGRWEGLTWDEIVALQPHAAKEWRNPVAYEPEGGERFEAVCARMASFYADLVRTAPVHVIVVTHAGALHATLHVLGLAKVPPAMGANFLPASVTQIDVGRDGAQLATLSDVSHLALE